MTPLLYNSILLATGVAAGTLNVLAGGGSVLTLPVLIFLGLPPVVANGTNRVAILFQNVGATWGFHRHGVLDWSRLAPALLPAVVGSTAGALVAIRTGDVAFQRILALVMFGVAAFTIWDPVGRRYRGGGRPEQVPLGEHPLGRWGLMATFFLVGIYGGFIQVGVGLVLLGVTTAWGMDLLRGNALKVLVVLCFTPVTLGVFAMSGNVDWATGFTLAVGTVLGGLLGVRLNLRMGHAVLRKFVATVVVLMAFRLLVTGTG